MDKQTSLFGEVVSDREVTLQIEFRIEEGSDFQMWDDKCTFIIYNGKYFPDGSVFGGSVFCKSSTMEYKIEEIIQKEKKWLEENGYRVKTIKKSILKEGKTSSLNLSENGDDEE